MGIKSSQSAVPNETWVSVVGIETRVFSPHHWKQKDGAHPSYCATRRGNPFWDRTSVREREMKKEKNRILAASLEYIALPVPAAVRSHGIYLRGTLNLLTTYTQAWTRPTFLQKSFLCGMPSLFFLICLKSKHPLRPRILSQQSLPPTTPAPSTAPSSELPATGHWPHPYNMTCQQRS